MKVRSADPEENLRRAVASRRVKRRLAAAQRLRDEPADWAIPLLLQLLADRRSHVQEAAADSLRTMSDPRGRVALLKALDDGSEWTRVIAARSLATEGESLAWPVLEAAFESEDVDVLWPAMDGIWRFEHARAAALTERIAREADDYPFLREMAVRQLGGKGTIDSVPAVEAALTDRQRYVRKAAVDAIAHIRARTAPS